MTQFHVVAGADARIYDPKIRTIDLSDILDSLRRGFDDFRAKPSHAVFLCLIYPVAGFLIGAWVSGASTLPLLFPLMSGFALLGPLAAIGLYEISRRRERGLDTSWRHALDVRKSPALPAIIAVGGYLVVLFVTWILVAQQIYAATFGDFQPASIGAFVDALLATREGLALFVFGNLAGLGFAAVVLATTVVAFPLLLDRDVGAVNAVRTSFRAVAANPGTMAFWGLIVAGLLVLGSLPVFAGLAVVLPILGHATWHLYRKVVAVDLRQQGRTSGR